MTDNIKSLVEQPEFGADNWAHKALLLMDEAESLIRWGSVSATPERYNPAAKAFWEVCHLLAAERARIAANTPIAGRAGEDVTVTSVLERIYLNLGDIYEMGEIPFQQLTDVSWCEDRIDDTDIEYTHVAAPVADSAMAKDAERYRWHAKRFRVFSLDMGNQHSYCPTGEVGRIRGATLVDAIDTAIAASAEKADKARTSSLQDLTTSHPARAINVLITKAATSGATSLSTAPIFVL